MIAYCGRVLEHDEKTLRFSDLLSVLVGEAIGKRIPGKLSPKFRNVAPTFYSARAPLHLCKHPKGVKAMMMYNSMMDERFVTFFFFKPLPKATRVKKWPKCGRCAAAFFMQGQTHPLNMTGQP